MAGLGGGDVGAAVNQNLLHPDTGPVARLLEPLVVGWLAPVFGMGGGHLVPGSTLANLTALWAARDLAGARTVVTSTAGAPEHRQGRPPARHGAAPDPRR
jgi:glutamate/tyrosine decarboxylase-like PLP-dependent enzyme